MKKYTEMEKIYLTAKETSQLLRISSSKLYKMTMDSAIPHYKFGGKLLFKRDELIEFVEKGITIKSFEAKVPEFEFLRMPSL